MAATKEQIATWFDLAPEGATHMIVVCDTFDWEDYPVYVLKTEVAREKYKQYNGKGMQKVLEIYDLSMSKDVQMAERAAWHF